MHGPGQGGQKARHGGIERQGLALGLHLVALLGRFRSGEPGLVIQAGFKHRFPIEDGQGGGSGHGSSGTALMLSGMPMFHRPTHPEVRTGSLV